MTPETMVAEAARLMLRSSGSGLPVLDRSGALVGIISEGDLLRRAETGTQRRRPRWLEFLSAPGRLAKDYAEAHASKVADAMTSAVVTIGPEAQLQEIVRVMERRHVKRLPVIEAGRLVGIVTRADLVRAFVDNLPPRRAALVPDTEIRDRIKEEIAKQPWRGAQPGGACRARRGRAARPHHQGTGARRATGHRRKRRRGADA